MMKKMMLPLLALIVGVFPAMAAVAGSELVVYSGRSDKFIRPVMEAFEKQSGIKVTIHNAKSAELINKLRIEGKKTGADLFISNDAGGLQVAGKLGLLTKMPDEIVKPIAANYRAQDNSWVGLSARARVLVVNTNKSADTGFINSVFDLADPKLKGKVGLTNSSNGSFIAGVTVYQQAAGDKKTLAWLDGLAANSGGRYYNKHSKVVRDVALGKKSVGLVNHYYIYRHLDKHPDAPIKIQIPDQGKGGMGVAWNVAGAGIVAHSKKQDQAMKLMKFLVSRAGQKMFAELNREYPTRADVEAAAQIPANGSYKVADVSMAALGKERVSTITLIDKSDMQ